MAAQAEAAFGQVHILVNNAGCNIRKPALEITWQDWIRCSIPTCAARSLWLTPWLAA